jgi:uncharacterized protein YuzE
MSVGNVVALLAHVGRSELLPRWKSEEVDDELLADIDHENFKILGLTDQQARAAVAFRTGGFCVQPAAAAAPDSKYARVARLLNHIGRPELLAGVQRFSCFEAACFHCIVAPFDTCCAVFEAEEVDDDVLPDVDDDNFLALGLKRDQMLAAKAFISEGYPISAKQTVQAAAVVIPPKPASAPNVPASCRMMNELLCAINHPELTMRWIEEEMNDSLLPDMEVEVITTF